jgi:cell division protein FtsB
MILSVMASPPAPPAGSGKKLWPSPGDIYKIDAMRWNLRKSNVRRALALSLGLLGVALAAYQVWGANGYAALLRKRQEEREWAARNQELQRKNQDLQKRVHDLHSNPQAIEKIAREELLLVKPEDRIILAPEKK